MSNLFYSQEEYDAYQDELFAEFSGSYLDELRREAEAENRLEARMEDEYQRAIEDDLMEDSSYHEMLAVLEVLPAERVVDFDDVPF